MSSDTAPLRVSPLRARMIEDMTVRGFKEDTRRDYVRNVRAFAAFIGRSPDTATAEDLRLYQLHQTQSGLQPPSINSAVSALRFFFTVTLDRPDLARRLTVVPQPRRIPMVLSVEEVTLLLQAASAPKYKAAFATAYGAGLRVSEVVALKVGDIDSERMLLRVERGKGGKSLMGWMAPEWHLCAKLGMQLQRRGPSMAQVTTIGLDLAKRVFQVHGVDAAGAVVLRRQLKRRQMVSFFTKFDWHGGVRHGASLGPHAAGSRPRGAADPTGLRQSLCAPEQDRPGRRRGYLRGGEPAVDALCPNQERSRPGDGGGASGARAADRAAHSDDQRAARADGRVRGGCRQGPAACQGTGGRAGRAGERARTAAPGFVGAGPNS